MKKLVVLTFVFALLASPFMALAGEKATLSLPMKVEGMVCADCVAKVKGALMKVEGVKSANVSLEKNEAVVEYDSATTNPKALSDAVKKAGYKATVKSEKGSSM
ncbi:MAG: heavy-metal-associated domain-containing protein [Nitrospirae bacterium]|nr:heavy-metal-associated domain-containing protein [Nitrospirota bacterium]